MLPFFRLSQELYTTALAVAEKQKYKADIGYEIITKPINIRNSFESGQTAGYLAIARVSKQQLSNSPVSLSPYMYCGRFEAEGGLNEPLVMYTRDPGMVIEYATSGAWVKNVPWPESEEDFIFGFFVPDTKKMLSSKLPVKEHANQQFGEYLRSCEASDHMGWSDPVKMTIVERIQKNTAKQLTDIQKAPDSKKMDATASRLSNKLGKLLMPRIGYAKVKPPGGGGNSGGGSGKSKNLTFEITRQTLKGRSIELDYRVKFAHAKRTAKVSLVIESEGGRIDASSWLNDIGTPFPATILSATVNTVTSAEIGQLVLVDGTCQEGHTVFQSEYIDAEIECIKGSDEYTSLSLSAKSVGLEISGTFKLYAKDRRYSLIFMAI